MAADADVTQVDPGARLGPIEGITRQADYWITVYRRTWKASIVTSFVSPLLYVLAMGVLLGGFVKVDPSRLEGATSYLDFIVPGLIAAQAMQTGVFECSYPVLGAIKWHKSFFAQLATPLAPRDLANAMFAFVLFRIGSTCGVYFLVMAPFGVFATWWGPVLAWLVTMLVGMAFAPWVFALSAHTVSEGALSLVFRLGMIPLFLFSGSFFPISNLGHVGAGAARLTPLWHGVSLTRMLCLDRVDLSTAAINVVVLVAVMVAGWWVACRLLAPEARPMTVAARPLSPVAGTLMVVLRHVRVFRRSYKVFLTGFLEPVFYLLSIGVGVGKLITSFDFNGHTVPYAEFVAPGMLAASAFNGALIDSTFNVFFRLKYDKLCDQILATPLTTSDIARGEILWGQLRGASYSAAFLVVMWALGLVHSWWAVLAFPAALLIGFAFSAVCMSLTTYMTSWQDFDKITLAQLPLFLFSGTFFPVTAFHGVLRWVVEATPLYRGVVLCRELTTGAITWESGVSVVYLVAMGAIGLSVVRRRLDTLLLT